MKTVVEVLKLSTSYLQERKIERGRRVAEELLSHALKLKRIDLYLQYDRPVEENELTQLRELLRRAGKGEPVEYILGEVSLTGCTIRIDQRVLIPRPETEILVELIGKKNRGKTVWDVCTGSGYIGIALKKRFPQLDVTLSDISPDALSLARENAHLNGVEVALLQGDMLAPFSGMLTDLIVCNPPYVSSNEYLTLDPSVRDFEPKLALVGGEDGLYFYERLARESPPFMKPGASLFLEIGCGQGEAVKEIFKSGPWKNQLLFQDWAGKDRFFSLEKQ